MIMRPAWRSRTAPRRRRLAASITTLVVAAVGFGTMALVMAGSAPIAAPAAVRAAPWYLPPEPRWSGRCATLKPARSPRTAPTTGWCSRSVPRWSARARRGPALHERSPRSSWAHRWHGPCSSSAVLALAGVGVSSVGVLAQRRTGGAGDVDAAGREDRVVGVGVLHRRLARRLDRVVHVDLVAAQLAGSAWPRRAPRHATR